MRLKRHLGNLSLIAVAGLFAGLEAAMRTGALTAPWVRVAAARVALRRRDVGDHVEVTRGPSGYPGLALSLQPDARAVLHARRNLHGELPLARDRARTATRRARLCDDAAGASALRTRPGDG